jgi:hypothetical protein
MPAQYYKARRGAKQPSKEEDSISASVDQGLAAMLERDRNGVSGNPLSIRENSVLQLEPP